MPAKNKITVYTAAIICAISFFVFMKSVADVKNKEIEMDRHRASMIKDNLELKERLGAIQDLLDKKIEASGLLLEEKKELSDKIELLKKENESLIASFQGQLDTLKRKNFILRKKIFDLEESPLLKRIKRAIEEEKDAEIKSALAEAVVRIENAQSGKEPANVPDTENGTPDGTPVDSQTDGVSNFVSISSGMPDPNKPPVRDVETGKRGVVVSIDSNNKLVVISLGSRDGVDEGDRLKILKNDIEVARGAIVSTRNRLSAAAIDDIKRQYKMTDIKEGDPAVMIAS